VLHRRPEEVTDPLFQEGDFFDPRDLVQVKYEMLRRVRVDRQSVTRTAPAFGFSRPTFYEARAGFGREGLPGLIPKKRGPRGAHKLTDDVVRFLEASLREDSSLPARALAQRVEDRFGVRIHPRTITRRLAAREKKRRRSSSTRKKTG
jgi:hypothetical protein